MILGPAGYGKTVLAMQIASAAPASILLDCSCVEPHLGCLSRAIAAAIRCDSVRRCAQVLLPHESEESVTLDLMDALIELPNHATCVVLDDLPSGIEPQVLLEIASCVRRALPAGRLVITSRRIDFGLEVSTAALTIGPSELRMRTHETRTLLEAATGRGVSEEAVQRAQAESQGHAAALRLIARSICLGTEDREFGPPLEANLQTYLQELARQQLSPQQLDLLFVLSLLISGQSSELRSFRGGETIQQLEQVSLCIPFVSLSRGPLQTRFAVHDLAVAAFTDPTFVRDHVSEPVQLRESVLALLDARGDYERLFRALLAADDAERTATWAESRGERLLDQGSLTILREVMCRIGPAMVLRSPRMLLLEASLLREIPQYREALRKATVARRLAEFECDQDAVIDSHLMIARLQMDLGWMGDAANALIEARTVGHGRCSKDTLALIHSYLGLCFMCVGRMKDAALAADSAAEVVSMSCIGDEVLARVMTITAATTGVLGGRMDKVLDLCLRIEGLQDVSHSLRLQNKGNLGTALCEVGHLRRAEQILEGALFLLGDREVGGLHHALTATLAVPKAGLGQYQLAEEYMRIAVAGLVSVGDELCAAHGLVFQSTWQRASGELDDSLATAERVLEMCASLSCQWLEWQTHLEMGATVLAMGDVAAAQRAAFAIRGAAKEVEASRHWLTADLILAEVARREGRTQEGIARLVEHEDYLLTESANWQTAMYIRAFPHLLGMLAVAVGPESLPVHLLRMVLPQDAERTLAACSDVLDDDTWRKLATRVVGDSDASRLERIRETPKCYVRFFGGLQVRVGDREVLDRHWRKRKARLMFAMLTARKGSEIPREQVFELLWPEMDEERARNNFYVIWSAMKTALVPQATKSTPCPYTENAGGMCRVVRELVTSDIEEFEVALGDAADAERQNNVGKAIRAYEQLADIYRGEFLPGDIYEDWFSHMRDTFRVEFGDAMLRAARLLKDEGDNVRALLMIRRGLRADPGREDLYQAAISLQIASGQRSAAIETYAACRKRLAEELGLDPSSDTVKLYEQVLAMEDPPESEWSDKGNREHDEPGPS